MHYYQHHIGDYRRDTAHLSLLEHGVYRQLLDWAYLESDPIPKETETVYRRLSARTQDEKNAVDIVLKEFFTLEIGYTQKRAEIEKQAYEKKAATARIAGKLGGRPKKTEEVISGLTELTDSKANHEPLTINHKPNTPKAPKGADVGFEEFWNAYPRKDAKPTALRAFAKVKTPLDILLKAIAAQKQSEGWKKEQGKFIPMPATWLNNERWNDSVTTAVAELDGETRAAIEKQAFEKGLSGWNAINEQWHVYRERVIRAPRIQAMSFDRLAAIAANRQEVPA